MKFYCKQCRPRLNAAGSTLFVKVNRAYPAVLPKNHLTTEIAGFLGGGGGGWS